MKYILDRGDQADWEVFGQLADLGSPAALKASEKATAAVKKGYVLSAAYNALLRYHDPALREEALLFVADEVRHNGDSRHRLAAARCLPGFGEAAEPAMLDVVRTHKDDGVRALVIWPVLMRLAATNTADDARLILDVTSANVSGHWDDLRAALFAMDSDAAVEVMLRRLKSEKTELGWRELLAERLFALDQDGCNRALVTLVSNAEPTLQLIAIKAAGERRLEQAKKAITSQLRSKDGAVAREAVIALGKIWGDEPRWRKNLGKYATSRQPAKRIGAAVALADLRTTEALELLHGLAADPDRAVRITAIREIANLRRKDGIALLIGRLAVEEPTIKLLIVRLLRLMTGEDFGMGGRWAKWWGEHEAGFQIPTYQVALARELERAKHRDAGGTQTKFYGLAVVSKRVCFILDTSGSMSAIAKGADDRTTTKEGKGSTRLAVAKEQLAAALRGVPDGDLFNLIFFESGVSSWSDQLTEMSASVREDALRFLGKQRPAGGTAVFDALDEAFQDDRIDTIFLLTDGDPSAGRIQDPRRLASEIARMNTTRLIQINCISIGQDSALLKQLAADSSGSYKAVL